MIQNFRDSDAEAFWTSDGRKSRPFSAFANVAMRKLRMIDAAASVDDLRLPPGNHLEALSGDRSGQHSIRINGQYRICFVWTAEGAKDVEIVDYH
jgi:proteic killer suppression protein